MLKTIAIYIEMQYEKSLNYFPIVYKNNIYIIKTPRLPKGWIGYFNLIF